MIPEVSVGTYRRTHVVGLNKMKSKAKKEKKLAGCYGG
jgi:hypothetical protein